MVNPGDIAGNAEEEEEGGGRRGGGSSILALILHHNQWVEQKSRERSGGTSCRCVV